MPRVIANQGNRAHTADVLTAEQVEFSQLLLSPPVLEGLTRAGFSKPSPIQLAAIPLGRIGADIIGQAKSGTGKTLVFSIVILENIVVENPVPQALILAPTREIAVQIQQVISTIGCQLPNLQCKVFIGGLSLKDDRQQLQGCHIIVGTPGRIRALLDSGALRPSTLRMVVLDEADQLLQPTFQGQVSYILSKLPERKQTMIFSATYQAQSTKHIIKYMRDPQYILLSADELSLRGVLQYYVTIQLDSEQNKQRKQEEKEEEEEEEETQQQQLSLTSTDTFSGGTKQTAVSPYRVFSAKMRRLLQILASVPFHQCIVFSNNRTMSQELVELLNAEGWPAVSIAGDLEQKQRMKAMEALRDFRVRVLVSTDLISRGIDIERVSLIINLDLPHDPQTYLHRVGRTGRFGTLGVAITFVFEPFQELKRLQYFAKELSTQVSPLIDPTTIPVRYFAAPESLTSDGDRVALQHLEEQRRQRQEQPQHSSKQLQRPRVFSKSPLKDSEREKKEKVDSSTTRSMSSPNHRCKESHTYRKWKASTLHSTKQWRGSGVAHDQSQVRQEQKKSRGNARSAALGSSVETKTKKSEEAEEWQEESAEKAQEAETSDDVQNSFASFQETGLHNQSFPLQHFHQTDRSPALPQYHQTSPAPSPWYPSYYPHGYTVFPQAATTDMQASIFGDHRTNRKPSKQHLHAVYEQDRNHWFATSYPNWHFNNPPFSALTHQQKRLSDHDRQLHMLALEAAQQFHFHFGR